MGEEIEKGNFERIVYEEYIY